MSNSPTTRFVDEDAPTTIDRTVCILEDPDRSEGDRPQARVAGRLRRVTDRQGWLVGVALAVLLVAGSFGAFLRQRTLSTELQRRLALLEREHQAIRSQTSHGSGVLPVIPPRRDFVEAEGLTRRALETHAVDALAHGNFAVALRYYEALSEQAREETVFVDFVSVLRSKSKCASPANRGVSTCP